MKRFFLAAACFTFLQFSCTHKRSDTPPVYNTDSAEHPAFFPVTEYLRGQLREIDTLPVTALKIITTNGKTDSIWMKGKDIRPFAEPFLNPVIDSAGMQSFFSEKSFLDQTINSVTLSYDPAGKLPDSLQLRRWNVYIDPQKNIVTRIYMVKEMNNNGIHQTWQLTWRSGKWCKITTITEQPGKQPEIKEETMKWDFTE